MQKMCPPKHRTCPLSIRLSILRLSGNCGRLKSQCTGNILLLRRDKPVPEPSHVDHSRNPPHVHIPRIYNAAYDLIQRNLRADPADKIAYIDDRRSLTFRELDARSSAFANTLCALGVEREQRVFMCMHDTVDFPVVFLGSIKAGTIPVPVNTLLTQSDYAYMLEDCRAHIAVVSAALLSMVEP